MLLKIEERRFKLSWSKNVDGFIGFAAMKDYPNDKVEKV